MIKAIKLLRIYTDEDAYLGDRRVFEVIASRARDTGLAGITVLEARLGFGRSAHIHQRRIFENGRALVIEIVDDEAKLRSFVTRSEEHTSELQSLMRISYAVFCLKKKK